MDGGESRLQEFLRIEEKRGDLCNLTDPSGLSYQSRPQRPGYAYPIRSRKSHTCLSAILLCSFSNAYHKSYAAVHGRPKAPVVESAGSVQ